MIEHRYVCGCVVHEEGLKDERVQSCEQHAGDTRPYPNATRIPDYADVIVATTLSKFVSAHAKVNGR